MLLSCWVRVLSGVCWLCGVVVCTVGLSGCVGIVVCVEVSRR